jgi:intein/homing endonuclease
MPRGVRVSKLPTKLQISPREEEFAKLIEEVGFGAIEAYRKAFNKRVEDIVSQQQARDLARSTRVKEYRKQLREQLEKQKEVRRILGTSGQVDVDRLREFSFDKLIQIRDDPQQKSNTRLKAVRALEALHDPSRDEALIMKWVELCWRYMEAHCPCCHRDFPLDEVKNDKIAIYREDSKFKSNYNHKDMYDRRMGILQVADRLIKPHPGQQKALEAEERHVVGTAAARCLEENEKITLIDGRVVQVKDLVGKVEKIKSFGPLGEQVNAEASFEDNGIKPVWLVETNSGRKIIRTGNHPILATEKAKLSKGHRTQIGRVKWVPIENLDLEYSLVAVPEQLQIEGSLEVSDDKIKLLGYMLGDGGITQGVTFTQKDGIAKNECEQVCKNLGSNIITVNQYTFRVNGSHKKFGNPVRNLLKQWGIYGKKSIEKKFPAWVWQLNNKSLALLLNRLFACDGWAYSLKRSNSSQIGICLASEEMIRDIQRAMIRLGIRGRVRFRKAKFKQKSFSAWEWCCTTVDGCEKFAKIVNIFGKEDKVAKVVQDVKTKNILEGWHESGLPEGYRWEQLRKIEYLGEKPTVNIYVPVYHTFITDLVEHNSGKSYLMAQFALMAFMIPGVEIWVLASIYESARSEVEYLRRFLRNLFYPYYDLVIRELDDKKSGELTFFSKWGSELKIRSAKSKGTISGRELELALIAEPAWVTGAIYNHLRARMSSRLGRILAFGTPQGTAGMLGRLVRSSGRDETGRIVRLSPQERLIKNGCPWGTSMLVYSLSPEENPGFVQSELQAARLEMTDEEYASEFEGRMDLWEGRKFHIDETHLVKVPREVFERAVFCLGIDQGPKNFGACLTAYDGSLIVPCWEYFNGDETTMQKNLVKLYKEVPIWIAKLGGDPQYWTTTITDRDPLLDGTFDELADEGIKWPHDILLRHHNNIKLMENWRRETQEWVNNIAKKHKLLFHLHDDFLLDQDQYPGASLLHDQMMNAMDVMDNPEKESKAGESKGWVITDAWRKDHVCDAAYFTMWVILSGQIQPRAEKEVMAETDPWAESKAAFEYTFAKDEQQELAGGKPIPNSQRVKFEDFFGRERGSDVTVPMGTPGYYEDE